MIRLSTKLLFITSIKPILTMGLFFILFSNFSSASGNYQLSLVANINHPEINDSQWLKLIHNPSNRQQFYIANKSGQIYLIDEGSIQPKPIFDLNTLGTQPSFHELTAITLHPNFAYRDQPGFATFYTAHIEPIAAENKTKRLIDKNIQVEFNDDAVLTEWQFNLINYQQVDITSKREILRIPLADKKNYIQQLSFNPFIKSWDDNFGLLYIALKGNPLLNKYPLYSGSMLRVNPSVFGLRNFTVPNTNPFLKTAEINNEIYLLGAQRIDHFLWPEKNAKEFLIFHGFSSEHLISIGHSKDDWRATEPKDILWRSNDNSAQLSPLMYRGRHLMNLRKKLLLTVKADEKWNLASLKLQTQSNNQPELAWLLDETLISSDSLVSMTENLSGEILLHDHINGMIYAISEQVIQAESSAAIKQNFIDEEKQNSSPFSFYFIALLFCTALGAFIYYRKKSKPKSASYLVRKQYVHLELSESKQQIGLYRRHQSNTDTIIDIVDLIRSEIRLNDVPISLINNEHGHGFSNEKETDLQNSFALEHRDKMVNNKIRIINLVLTDKKQQSYSICLYVRKGNTRVTKKDYRLVISELIDWCWLIAQRINPDATGQRKPKSEIEENKLAAERIKTDMPLHQQAALAHGEKWRMNKATVNESNSPKDVDMKETTESDFQSRETMDYYPSRQRLPSDESSIDTELVNALEKLVRLKQQGFLTDDEFNKAKAKLLQNLFE